MRRVIFGAFSPGLTGLDVTPSPNQPAGGLQNPVTSLRSARSGFFAVSKLPGVSYRSRALKSTSPPMNPVGLSSSGQKHQTVMLASPLPWRSQISATGVPWLSVR